MGKKDKKKGKGAEKTAAKTDKKLSQKMKKELAVKGEDEIEKIVAQIEEEERKRKEVVIKAVSPPSCRSNFSFTAHPEKDELILFGGEYFNGQKTFMYNDLLLYNVAKAQWTAVVAPGGPPPRCSHQAAAVPTAKGQLWVFGGEFASPTQSQFYHYRDLWVYHCATNQWEKINAAGAPSSRSGHRMVCVKKQLIVFGGFHDNLRDYKYFNDVHIFNLETRTWSKLEPSGTPPAPRSACQMVVTAEGKVLVFGGYSKTRVKKDEDKGTVHSDAFLLAPDKNDASGTKWKWSQVKLGGAKYSPRCGVAVATMPAAHAAYTFGGVFDQDNDEDEEVDGVFYNDLHCLDLDKLTFRTVSLSGSKKEGSKPKRRRKNKEDGDEAEDSAEEMEADDVEVPEVTEVRTVSDDGVFTVTVGPATSFHTADGLGVADTTNGAAAANHPRPRSNCGLAVKHGCLYMFGGIYEHSGRTYTLSDLQALDLHKLDEWKTLVSCDLSKQEWFESSSESESEEEDSEEDDEGEEEQDEGMETE